MTLPPSDEQEASSEVYWEDAPKPQPFPLKYVPSIPVLEKRVRAYPLSSPPFIPSLLVAAMIVGLR